MNYNVWMFLGIIINLLLKGMIQEPRPMYDKSKVNVALMHTKQYMLKNGIPFNLYGMPSGHAQMMAYSTCFLYLATENRDLAILCALWLMVSCVQRVHYEFHTITQVCVGVFLGVLIGIGAFKYSTEEIKGKREEKQDDYAPKGVGF